MTSSTDAFITQPRIHATILDDGIKVHNQPDIRSGVGVLVRENEGIVSKLATSCFSRDYAETDVLQEAPGYIGFDKIVWAGPEGLESGSSKLSEMYSDNEGAVSSAMESRVLVSYLQEVGPDLVPKTVTLSVDSLVSVQAKQTAAEYILSKAYGDPRTRERRVLVVINPNGGKGLALRIFNKSIKPVLDAAHVHYDIMETKYHYHCIDIAKEMDFSKYDVVACCSGDGIPHEVINGIYKREDRAEIFSRIIITQLPCGSGNALSLSCHRTLNASHATLSMLKSPVIKMDLMAVYQGVGHDVRSHLSFLSQTYGIIADADIGTEWMRKLGPSRFELGVTCKVLAGTKYPCELYVKYTDKSLEQVTARFEQHLKNKTSSLAELADSIFNCNLPDLDKEIPSDWEKIENTNTLSVFYTGKMPYIAKDVQFFPAAAPNDGTMDLVVLNTNAGLLKTTAILTSLDSGKQIFYKELQYSKIKAYRLIPHKNNYVSVDGETFPLEPLQAEIIPNVLNIIAKDSGFHKTVLHN